MQNTNDFETRLQRAKENLKAKKANPAQVDNSIEKPKNPGYKYYDPSNKTSGQGMPVPAPLKQPVTAQQPQQVTTQQAPPNKSFLRNIADGIKVETPRMFGNIAQGVAELADMAPSILSTSRPMGMDPLMGKGKGFDSFGEAYKRELDKQEKGESTPALKSFREFAKKKYQKAEELTEEIKPDPESWGYMVGSLIPQGAGIATAVGVGAFNPAAGMALGIANMGGLTAMAGGAAAKEYDDYIAEKGLEVNPNDKLGTMLLTMAAEAGSEAIPVAKFIPKGFRGKMGKFIFGNTEVMSKRGAALLEEFANTSNSRKQLVKNVSRSIVEGALTEGPTEAFAELGSEFSSWLYKEKKDRATWQEITERAVKAAAGGAILGGAIGPMSYGAQQVQNRRRRAEAGKVIIAQEKTTGEAVEIMGMSNTGKDGMPPKNEAIKYQAIRPNGKIVEVDENNLDGIIELPLEDFNGLLKGKGKALQDQTNQKNQEKAAQAQQQANEIRNQYQPMAYQGADGNLLISGAKFNGEEVFVTAMLPDGSAVIQKPGEEKKVVKQDGITEVETMPFDQFLETFGPSQEQTQPTFTANPIQKGERIDIAGESYLVTGVDQESGTVVLENENDPSDLPTLQMEELEQYRQATQQNTQQPSTEAANELRKIFEPSQEPKAGDQISLGGAQVQPDTSLPKATPEAKQQYTDISGLIEKKLGVKFDFQPIGLQGEVRTTMMKDFLANNAGEIGAELADIIEFPKAAQRFLNNLPDVDNAQPTAKPDNVPTQPTKQELGGKEQPASENVPQEPVGKGTDGEVQVDGIGLTPPTISDDDFFTNLINNKEEQEEVSKEDQELQEREDAYQKSKFDKKWAPTYKSAVEKLKNEYNEALAKRTEWENKSYKKNDGSVWVGGELEGGSKNIGNINESRRRKSIKSFNDDMIQAVNDMRSIGMSKEEIDQIINQPTTNELQQAKQEPKAGQDDVKTPQDQKDSTPQAQGQKRVVQSGGVEDGAKTDTKPTAKAPAVTDVQRPASPEAESGKAGEGVKGVKKPKPKPRKKTPEQIRREDILNRQPTTAKGFARRWLLEGGKLKSTQSLIDRAKGVGVGKGVMDETGMAGREMRQLVGIINNKTGLSPEVAAERIMENLTPEQESLVGEVQDLRNALLDVLLSENRKDWLDNQDRETQDKSIDDYEKWAYSQLSEEEQREFDVKSEEDNYYSYIADNPEELKRLAAEYDQFVQSDNYIDYIEQILDENDRRKSQTDVQDSDSRRYNEQEKDDRRPDEPISAKQGKEPSSGVGPINVDQSEQKPGSTDIGNKAKPEAGRNQGVGNDIGGNLNPKGKALQTLESAKAASLPSSAIKTIEGKIDFLRDTRKKYPSLTDTHENEIFDALNQPNADRKAITKKIDQEAGSFAFNPKETLGLSQKPKKETVPTKRGEIDQKIDKITKRLRDIAKLPKSEALNEEKSLLTKELGRLQQNRQETQTKDQATKEDVKGDLFGEKEDAQPTSKEYKFELQLRPFSQSPYPKEDFIRFEEKPGSKYGLIVLKRPLNAKEVKRYEVLPVSQIEEIKDKSFVDQDGNYSEITVDWTGSGDRFVKVSFYEDGKLVEDPFDFLAVDILENLESGYWKVKPTPKTAKELNEVVAKRKENTKLAPQTQDDEKGNQVSQRGTQKELRGSDEGSVRVQAADRLKNDDRANAEKLEGLSIQDRNDLENRIIFDFAKENNLWIEDVSSLGEQTGLGGQENTIFTNSEEKSVYKSNNLSNTQFSVSAFLEQVKIHNELFPENRLEVIGFTGNENKGRSPYIEVVLKQNFIPNAVKATTEEIASFMESIGFKPTGKTTEFTNGVYTVSDLHPRNVLKDELGNINVIDNIIKANTKPTTAKGLNEVVGRKKEKETPVSENETPSPENLGIKTNPEKVTTNNESDSDQSSLEGKDISDEGEWSDEQVQEQDSMIQDFGEKIGGAKKDEAQRGYKLSKVNEDKRPAWAKKYKVFEMDKGASYDLAIVKGNFFRTIKKGFKTEQEAIDVIPMFEVSINHRVYMKSDNNFAVYRVWKSGKSFSIKEGFATKDAAMADMAINAIDYINWKAPEIERPHLDEVSRKGVDYRKGKKTTPEMFQETFGFRGGEFGNWVRSDERQKFLDFAYDGLMDLSGILNVPPKALSLNGKLAIAFGSRGSGLGSAAAHYERTRLVINLTKIKGAGSLAHEWFHAFDHYLGMLDGKASSEWNEDGKTIKAKTRENDYLSHSHSLRSKIRPELLEKFMAFRDTMFKKEVERQYDVSKQEAALKRSTESLEKSLNGIRKDLETPRMYGNKKTPATPEQLAEFDVLAQKILAGKHGKDNWIQSPKSKWKGSYEFEVETEIKALYKKAKGRMMSDYLSIHQEIKRNELNQKTLEEAKKGTSFTVKANTNYFNEAKKIDESKAAAYWSTPHEMAARAFEAYIEDEILKQGESTYLVFGADNKFYRLFDVKPYPEGQERIDINNKIKEVFEAIKVDEDVTTMPMFMKVSDQTQTPSFKAWFGDSKVVNPDGSPMVVYHGSPFGGITSFDNNTNKTASSGLREYGFMFSTNKPLAGEYARLRKLNKNFVEEKNIEIEKLRELRNNSRNNRDFYQYQSEIDQIENELNPKVYETFLKMENPFIFDAKGKDGYYGWQEISINIGYKTAKGIEAVEAISGNNSVYDSPYDGIIAKNIVDLHIGRDPDSNDKKFIGDVYVVFSPNQIKSATGNSGAFDGNNPDIRFSKASDLTKALSKPTKKAVDISDQAAKFTATWNNAPNIVTVNSAQEAYDRYPDLRAKYTIDDVNQATAIFLKNPDTGNPEVVLIASHSYFNNKGSVEKAILHEVIGHYGVREFLKQQTKGNPGKYQQEFKKLMEQVFEAKKGDKFLEDISDRYYGKPSSSLTESQKLIVADEYLAHMAQEGVQDSWVDKVVAKFRQLLRELGINLGLSDAEIRNILGNSMRIVRGNNGRPVLREGVSDSEAMKMLKDNMNAKVINGFYSPIEQRLLDFKQPKASATKWKEIVGKKDEAQWTGVYQYLDGLKPDQQVTKQELLDWMKENRVEIVEVVKGGFDDSEIASWWNDEGGANEETDFYDLSTSEKREARERYQDEVGEWDGTDTKFSQYQLEGEKSDYKEVLVTLPSRSNDLESITLELFGKKESEVSDQEFRKAQDVRNERSNATFKSSHFDEPNILVHLRMNTRTAADGSKVLFLEEVQSDWGQKGKKEGFNFSGNFNKSKITTKEVGEFIEIYYDGKWVDKLLTTYSTKEEIQRDILRSAEFQFKARQKTENLGIVPAPFVTDTNSWVKLGLKVAMKEAVAQGADRIAWTTGTQQNERYDLSKQVDKIYYSKNSDGTYEVVARKDGGHVFKENNLPENKIEDYIGKEIAQKIINNEGKNLKESAFDGELSGLDLQVGGTGMKAFYGDPSINDIGMVGRVAESIVDKGMVGMTEINTGDAKYDAERYDGTQNISLIPGYDYIKKGDWLISDKNGNFIFSEGSLLDKETALDTFYIAMEDTGSPVEEGKGIQTQHSIPVTPELIDQVERGLPMFMKQPSQDQTQTEAFKAWFGDSKVVDSEGKPLVVYHGTDKSFNEFQNQNSNKDYLVSNPNDETYFFADSKKEAEIYGKKNVISAYLSVQNLANITNDGWNLGENTDVIADIINNTGKTNELASKLKELGYDGFVYDDGIAPRAAMDGLHYVAFSPTQIKSATGNQGTFDPSNSDIRFMKVGASNPDFSAINSKNYETAQLSWFERKVIEPLQDRMIRSKKLINSKTGGKISDKADFYTKENLASGKTLEKARVFEKDLWNPLLETAQKIVKETGLLSEDISNYLKFKHHAERKAYFIEQFTADGKKIPKDERWPTGMTDQEAADGIANFEATVSSPLVKELNRRVHKVNQFTTFERYKAGMITKETFRDLLTRYKNYVPLTDWKGMETNNDRVYTLLMSAKGRTSESADPMPFMFTAAQEAIMRGENNRVRQGVLEFVKENVSPGDYFIRQAYYVNTKSQDEFGNDIWLETMNKPTKQQIDSGEAMRSFNPNVHRTVQQQGELETVLPVMVKGKKVFIEFTDKEIVSSIKNINQDKLPGFLNHLRGYTRWLSSMYTQYSPEFGVRNLIRDVGFGTFNILVEKDASTAAKTIAKMGRSGATLRTFFATGEYTKGKDGNMLREFMEEGSMTGFTDLKTAADIFKQAKKTIDNANKRNIWKEGGNALVMPLKAVGDAVEVYNKVLENSMRFSYYKTLREQGVSKQQAAAAAKDLTVNFNRKGRSSSFLGSIYIFFNASVQGSERLIRVFVDPKTRKKALQYGGTVMMAGLMQSILYGLFDDEDEDGRTFYEKIPDYTRRNNIIIPNMISDDPNDFIKIPLPYGVNILHSFGESLGQVLTGKKTLKNESLGMLSAMTNVFSPIGGFEFNSEGDGFEQSLNFVTPSAVAPVSDLAFNRNFSGRPIYRENFTSTQYKRPDSQMYFEGVNPYIKEATTFLNKISGGNEVISGKIDINPEWIEYGMEQYLGGPVQFTKNVSTTIAHIANGEDISQDPFIRSVPFVRSYIGKTGTDFEARSTFYENRDTAIAAKEAWEIMQEEGLQKDADQFYKENESLIQLGEEFKEYNKYVKQYNQSINELKKMDIELYKDEIDKLYEEKTQIMRQFNKRYGEEMYRKRDNPLKNILNIK